jgi:hypothetical protein
MASEKDTTSSIPAIFADGVVNFNNSSEFAKFYLFRWDPPWASQITGDNENKLVPAAQIIMPLDSAFQAVAFLHAAIENLAAGNKDFAQKWANAKQAASVLK